jgi:hypothetical protein
MFLFGLLLVEGVLDTAAFSSRLRRFGVRDGVDEGENVGGLMPIF